MRRPTQLFGLGMYTLGMAALRLTLPPLICVLRSTDNDSRPCHNSVFDCTGQRSINAGHPSNPSPRDLDRLETKLIPILGREGDFHVASRHETFIQAAKIV